MANTIREQIITAYTTHLTTEWTVAKGYNYGCSPNIFRAVKVINDDVLPSAVLFPMQETAEPTKYGFSLQTMKFKVEALTAIETNINPSITQEKLLGDIIKIMTLQSYTVTALIDSIDYVSGGVGEFAKGEDTYCGAYAEFDVKYSTISGNPYSQTT